MSDPLWIGVGIGTAVGTATIDTSGVFTIVGHGLVDGQPVRLDTLTGGATSVFAEDTTYYVVNAATDTFSLVSIPGDTVIAPGSSGGADVHTAVPHYTAAELRRGLATLLWPADQGSPSRFGAREGIRPGGGDVVTMSGTTWTVHDVCAVVDPRVTSSQGPYIVQHPEESGSLDPADGTNDRIDALDLQVQDDDEDASGVRRARVVYVVGTPAPSPSAPSLTTNSLRLATILVPSGGSPAPSVSTLARHSAALGGVLTVADSTELASINNASEYEGQYADVLDDQVLVRRMPSTGNYQDNWSVVASPYGWVPVIDSVDGTLLVDVAIANDTVINIPTAIYTMVRLFFRGSITEEARLTMRVNDDSTAGLHGWAWGVWRLDTGSFVAGNAADGTVWPIAQWSTSGNNVAEATIFGTKISQGLSFEGEGSRIASGASLRQRTFSKGHLTASRLLDSLRFSASSGTLSATVTVEGFRA